MAAISFAVHPASANLRAAALRNPWVTHRSGKPALSIFSAMKPLPKPLEVNGLPKAVRRIVPSTRLALSSTSCSTG